MTIKSYPIILFSDTAKESYYYKAYCAGQHYRATETGQTTNGDEALEIDRSGTLHRYAVFSKTLPHNARGEVESADFDLLAAAVESGLESDFNAVPAGDTRKLVNPRATRSFSSAGRDQFGYTMPAPPAFTSRTMAAEMLEVYEHALNRDSTFSLLEDSGTPDADADRAVANLNVFGLDFLGKKDGGVVTRKTLFRGAAQGTEFGPYISQFLYQDIPYGAGVMVQQYNEETGTPHGTTLAGYLDIQNGVIFDPDVDLSGVYKYIHTPRVLGSYVHRDAVFQSFLNAALILLGAGAPLDSAYAMVGSREEAFVTHGTAEILHAVTSVARSALKAAWVQKWHHHRRLRPEVFACRVHHQDIADTVYSIHADLMGSSTVTAVKAFNTSGTALLPLQYPEGSPAHPSYPAGHATFSGACATVLKALFNESTDITTLMTVQHSTDGSTLAAYGGSTAGMTVGTELNKLAANISIGRDWAGVHYRSDGDIGMELGEKVAISFLEDLAASLTRERGDFTGFTLTKFNGVSVTITG